MKTRVISVLLFIFSIPASTISGIGMQEHEPAVASGSENTEHKFNPSVFILDHVTDSHEWHLITRKNGESVAIYLPVILYSREKGLDLFSSRRLAHGHEYKGYRLEEEGKLKGKIVNVNESGEIDEENLPFDFSMTKTVVGMLAAAIIGLLLFISLSRSYRKSGISHPKGIQKFLEPAVLFVRDDIAIPNIGIDKYEKYMPYLLSAFFFILINNLMGLIPFPPPFGANVTGNIALTFVLAFSTFVITQFSGNRIYWKHIFMAPGVPWWLLFVMIPVELIGIISKPFALMIRLFANITAGHIIVLSLLCLIFIFDSLLIAPVSIFFVVFMDCLELLVAFLQAYIFTLLSALFISMATPVEHH